MFIGLVFSNFTSSLLGSSLTFQFSGSAKSTPVAPAPAGEFPVANPPKPLLLPPAGRSASAGLVAGAGAAPPLGAGEGNAATFVELGRPAAGVALGRPAAGRVAFGKLEPGAVGSVLTDAAGGAVLFEIGNPVGTGFEFGKVEAGTGWFTWAT